MDLSKDIGAACEAGFRLTRRWREASAGEQLRALRLERRVSQRHLAQEAGVAQSVVCRLERGADARLSTWKRLFGALGCFASLALVPYAEEVEDLLAEGRDKRQRRQAAGLEAGWYRGRGRRRW